MEKEIKRTYPNPAKTVVEIEIISNHDCLAEAFFLDPAGERVFKVPYEIEISKGNNTLSLNLAPLIPGRYDLHIQCELETLKTSIEVLR